MQRITALLLGLGAILTGCGGDSPTDAITYENIAGTYTGTLSEVTEGITLTAFSLTIVQSDGNLTGSYSIEGTLEDSFRQLPMHGPGNVSGTIALGQNPSVIINLLPGPPCGNVQDRFSGAYDSANRRITMTGTLAAIGLVGAVDQCHYLFGHSTTVVLNR